MSIQLTIGTAVYNVGEPFLREHIEGVMRQLTDETELLLIDDCSTDNSGEICREYAEKDERVRCIRLDHNSWLSTVRNRTIAEAQGKWILFADGDDLLSDHCVETFLRFCPRYNEAAYDIVIHDRLKFVGQKQPEQPCTLTDVTELPPEAGRALSVHACASIRRSARRSACRRWRFTMRRGRPSTAGNFWCRTSCCSMR